MVPLGRLIAFRPKRVPVQLFGNPLSDRERAWWRGRGGPPRPAEPDGAVEDLHVPRAE